MSVHFALIMQITISGDENSFISSFSAVGFIYRCFVNSKGPNLCLIRKSREFRFWNQLVMQATTLFLS